MSSVRRKQNNPTKSASDILKKERVGKPAKSVAKVKAEPDESSLARSRPQRKIIPKRPLSPDVELSSRRKKRRKKKASPAKPVNLVHTLAVHIQPEELKPPKLSKQQKASLKVKKKKRKKKTFVFPILASDRVPREPALEPPPPPPLPSKSGKKKTKAKTKTSGKGQLTSKKKAKSIAKNVLDVDLLRMLPASELVKRFAKHTSFKVPTEEPKAAVKQHVYTCKMLPHYCTEKFYGNDEDTKRQITKHLLRHVGELLTVTNRGINLLTPTGKKVKPEKAKKEAKKSGCGANSTMYILPSAPRPMRVTLPKNVSSRMKRSSYTVIRSGDKTERGINEVVLLPKGRLLGIMNAPKLSAGHRSRAGGKEEVEDLLGSTERVVVRKGDGIREGTATKVTVESELVEPSAAGLSIESLAKAVEAMVDKESQGLNIQAAEALAQAISIQQQQQQQEVEKGCGSDPLNQTPIRVYKATKVPKVEPISPVSSPSFQSSNSSPGSSPSTSSSSPTNVAKSPVKVRKLSKSKKKTSTVKPVEPLPLTVDSPHDDHNYALSTASSDSFPLHLDSLGRPTDTPQNVEEFEPDKLDVDPLVSSMNDQLNRLIADIDAPAPLARVSNENVEPVIGEGANVTVEQEEYLDAKSSKAKLKMMAAVSMQTEEVKQTALAHLQSLAKVRKRKGPFTCEICNKVLTAASTLRAHYRSHAGIKPYQCEICQATFTRLHSLKYHTMIHNKEARFLCSYCQRQFRHSSHYREHLRRHTGEEPFGCSDCPARFKTRNTYKRHLRSKHGKVVAEDGKINLAPTMFPA